MRKLNKGIPYKAFSEFVTENRPTSWDEIKHLTYDMRLYMLCYEQDCLCGYSEIPIGAENTESHIDHFVKQEHDCQKIFSWDNFVVSTVDEDFGGKYKDNTYRIQKNEYALIFNPVFSKVCLAACRCCSEKIEIVILFITVLGQYEGIYFSFFQEMY